MPFEWLNTFRGRIDKDPHYAARTLAAYARGMKAGGAIVGVAIQAGADCCLAARELPGAVVYRPSEAPRLPLPGCPLGPRCRCVYRPVMSYQRVGSP
jgi:hypothetical protein